MSILHKILGDSRSNRRRNTDTENEMGLTVTLLTSYTEEDSCIL